MSLIKKSLENELQEATFLVLKPDSVDGHGDTYSKEEVRKAARSFSEFSMKANVLHAYDTEDFKIVENYTLPADLTVAGETFPEGSWFCVCKFQDNLWPLVKDGTFNGISIQAMANVETLNDE